jgi:phasin family protein
MILGCTLDFFPNLKGTIMAFATATNATTEHFANFSKTSIDAMLSFAKVSMESTERFMALNLEAAKVSMTEGAKNAKALASVKEMTELNSLRTNVSETGVEFATNYSKNLYDLATSAQASFSGLIEAQSNKAQKAMAENMDAAAKNAPAGSDVFFAAIKTAMAASTTAADTFTKAAKQGAAFAETNFKAAAPAAAKRK